MGRFTFHKLAALAVLVGFTAWVATGEFSSVGSAQNEAAPKPVEAEAAAPLRTVAVVTPPRINHARAIRVSGHTEADKRSVLASRDAGVIAELPVRQGDTVRAGDLIMMLDAEGKAAAVETAEAQLKQRQAEYEAAERLANKGQIAKLQLDNSFSALAQAKSGLQIAQAELDRKQVRAPFDGIVDRVNVELGSAILQSAEVATVLALDPIIGKGEVSERDLRYLKIGDKASVRLVNGETVSGTIRYISRDASQQTRTFPIEIAIHNPTGTIPAGMTAEITVQAQPADAVVLPRSVVTLSNNGDLGIRAVDPDSRVVFFPIDLVDDMPKGLILAGIPADARIIVAGQDLVTEGDLVKTVVADQATIDKLIGETGDGTQ